MTQSPRILRPSKVKTLALLAVCAGFVWIGVWQGLEGEAMGWAGAVFFGIGVVVAAITLLPNSSFLLLDRDGFTIRSLFQEGTYKWTDVDPFAVGRVGAHRMVIFDFSEQYVGSPRARKIASAITGTEGALPDSYGLSLEQLAETMNAARDEALRSRP